MKGKALVNANEKKYTCGAKHRFVRKIYGPAKNLNKKVINMCEPQIIHFKNVYMRILSAINKTINDEEKFVKLHNQICKDATIKPIGNDQYELIKHDKD